MIGISKRPIPFSQDQRGQSMVEYGVALALISAVCFSSLQLLGGNTGKAVGSLTNQMGGAGTTSGMIVASPNPGLK